MSRLRGRTSLTIILMIVFALLVIMYHLLSSEVDDSSSSKSSARLRIEEAYPLSELTESPVDVARRQQYEAQIMGRLRSGEQYKSSERAKYDRFDRNSALFKGHKIVHLDLKGAPPVVDYYSELLGLLNKLGATGILLEYEDMFPFHGEIRNISATNCYSKEDIAKISRIAEENNLIVIPLVQTFGHLEFLLKLAKYKDFREVFRYPQVICPTYNGTLPLIYRMIDQVVEAHPNMKHLHIGADEVYHLGECSRCLETMAKNQWGKRQLFLSHVTKVASYVKDKYPDLTILMWDDEFREISPAEIRESGLNKLVEPVVWKYTTDPGASLTDQLWESYAAVWPSVWIATAFKGATEPDRYYTDISYHLENHQRWLEIISKYSRQINFKGAMLTGWQRYDHFSVLCELLASALPSLAVNLAVLQSSTLNSFPVDLPPHVSAALGCEGSVSLSIPEPQYGWTKCSFQGVKVYAATLRLYSLQQELNRMEEDNTFKGWLKPYNIKHAFSSPSHVERAVAELDRHKMEILYIEKEMREAMDGIYDSYTLDEWLETFLVPLNEKVTNLWEAKEKILDKYEWPRRPLTRHEL